MAILRGGAHLVVRLQSRGELDVARKPATRGRVAEHEGQAKKRKGWGWKTKGGWIGASRTCCSARASGWRPGRGPHQCQSGPKRSPSRPHLRGLLRGHSRSPPRIGRDRPRRYLVNPCAPLTTKAAASEERISPPFVGKSLPFLAALVWGDKEPPRLTRSRKQAKIH